MMKCILRVARSRANSTACRPANEALVAASSVDVGPGVKIEDHKDVRKSAILAMFEVGTRVDPKHERRQSNGKLHGIALCAHAIRIWNMCG